MLFDLEVIERRYKDFISKLQQARSLVDRPLTLTEKILYAHLVEITPENLDANTIKIYPDRVAMQDMSAQTLLLLYASSYNKCVEVATTLHCDRLIVADQGAKEDLMSSLMENKEIYDFLESASRKFGIGYWKPDSGTMHQILLENYHFPGGVLLGADFHTPHAGGMGMLGFSVGDIDIIDIMAGLPWEMPFPKIIGVKLLGQLKGWTSAKDVILHLAGVLNFQGAIVEFFGEGISSISTTGRAAICNLCAEIGAISALFPYDGRTSDFLRATDRSRIVELARNLEEGLSMDPEIEEHPDLYYDQILTLNLTDLEPHINGPFSVTQSFRLTEFSSSIQKNEYPQNISAAFIGSCSNSSYEDFDRLRVLANQALKHGLKIKCPLYINLGSEQIHTALVCSGIFKILQEIGVIFLAKGCGPSVGQWKRKDVNFGEKNSIITTYNSNAPGRNDGNPGTHAFLASPEMVTVMALAGSMTFNPIIDLLFTQDGLPVKLEPPEGSEFPPSGFIYNSSGYLAIDKNEFDIPLAIDSNSQRLQLIPTFSSWKDEQFKDLRILAKIKGKCTLDHISPAGKWIRFRAHLEHLSDNFLSGALNAYHPITGKGKNALTGDSEAFAKIAKQYKTNTIGWVLIAEENYGEGVNPELAAMESRYLGGVAILAKSFSPVYELHLKKLGLLALTFANGEDFEKILEDDLITIEGLNSFSPEISITISIQSSNKSSYSFVMHHSYTSVQIEWFRAGGSLNTQKRIQENFKTSCI